MYRILLSAPYRDYTKDPQGKAIINLEAGDIVDIPNQSYVKLLVKQGCIKKYSPVPENTKKVVLLPDFQDISPKEDISSTYQAKRLASKNNVDLGDVVGTGPNGKITKSDVSAFIGGK